MHTVVQVMKQADSPQKLGHAQGLPLCHCRMKSFKEVAHLLISSVSKCLLPGGWMPLLYGVDPRLDSICSAWPCKLACTWGFLSLQSRCRQNLNCAHGQIPLCFCCTAALLPELHNLHYDKVLPPTACSVVDQNESVPDVLGPVGWELLHACVIG